MLSDVVGFINYTARFSSSNSTDDTGITMTQWYVNDQEQSQASSFSYDFANQGRYTIKLVITDQDGQTDSATIKVDAITDGQTALACDSALVFMAKKLWVPFFGKCIACHTPGGIAGNTNFALLKDTNPTYLSQNLANASKLLDHKLFHYPQGGHNHTGGTVFLASDPIYTVLTELQKRVLMPPTDCP